MPGDRAESLRVMRAQMLRDTDPAAAIFVGGMPGIREEHELFTAMFPERPSYALGRPGGEAQKLAEAADDELAALLRESDAYPVLFRRVVADIAARLDS